MLRLNIRKYMESSSGSEKRSGKLKLIVAVAIVSALVAGLVGWNVGRSSDNQSDNRQTQETDNSTGAVKELVSYKLPDGWKEGSCPSSEAVYINPDGTSLDCEANPSSPVKISVDTQGATDCNQLQNVQNVRKHICSSEFISGKKTLRAETIYNQNSDYKKETTIKAYHIDAGRAVVKIEYTYNSDGTHSIGFEQLAKSVSVKN